MIRILNQKAIETLDKLLALPEDQFRAKMDAIQPSDLSEILQESGAIEVIMSKENRDPYLDEDHLYNKYESMKMANERNMDEKHKAQKALHDMAMEMQAIKWFTEGQNPTGSTGICEGPTFGYGKLDDNGYWEFQLPGWFVESDLFTNRFNR